MNFKPVIFLAFANDKVDNAAYLRNLSVEQHGIRKSLEEAVRIGLCDIVERSSTTVSDILDVFSDPNYGPRISIFHYGGHADGFSLLLESEDGTKTLTHKDGLVPFLARQENLKLVFLNGCSSEGQATDLLKAGIPAVIGTTASINDEIATALAMRFYSSLGDGSGIEKAWTDATDEVKIKEGTGNSRALFWEGKKEIPDRFPWVIQFKAGADIIRDWNLPDISGNPLYGLPAIPQTFNLPEVPFLYLNRYERRHAEVFFGRSFYIRSLFSSVNDTQSPPIILLYGQSGVGKSSLLEAGLQPRLESKYEIIYLRRVASIGLSNTVYYALLEKCGFTPEVKSLIHTLPDESASVVNDLRSIADKIDDTYKPELHLLIEKISNAITIPSGEVPAIDPPKTISEAWKLAEKKLNKAVVIILDQIEEAYTRPNDRLRNEVNQLFFDLKAIFNNPANVPQGKIVLSFRKEYHPEIDECCKNYELPRSKVFVEHITKNDVLEVFRGFLETPRLKSRYNLSIEDGVPEIVSTDIAIDEESPIAPMLQILLTKMWIKAVFVSSMAPAFTHDLYRVIKDEGLAMDEFLMTQLTGIKKKTAIEYSNGFVLDVLNFYCTPNSTSAAHTAQQLRDYYPDASTDALKVLDACKELYLITDLGGTDQNAMLAHDTLAKSVVKLYSHSSKPLQQAKRVIAARMEAVRGGSTYAALDQWDLQLIDGIKKFLPKLSDEEKKLIDTSRLDVVKKEKEKKALSNIKKLLVILTIIGAVLTGGLYYQSNLNEKEARRNARLSHINKLAASSINTLNDDPTRAINQISQGILSEDELIYLEVQKSLSESYYYPQNHNTPWYTVVDSSTYDFSNIIYSDTARLMIPYAEEEDSLKIYDYDGAVKGMLTVDGAAKDYALYENDPPIKWSHDGHTIVVINNKGEIELHDANGTLRKNISNEMGYSRFAMSPNRDEFSVFTYASTKGEGIIVRMNTNGENIDSFKVSDDLHRILYSPNGDQLILLFYDGTAKCRFNIVNLKGKILLNKAISPSYKMTLSPSGNVIAFVDSFGVISMYDPKGNMLHRIDNPNGSNSDDVMDIAFSPSSEQIAVGYNLTDNAFLFNLKGEHKKIQVYQKYIVTSVQFSQDGRLFLTTSGDKTATVWDAQSGKELYKLKGHGGDVTRGIFTNHDKGIITVSLDGTLRNWNLENYAAKTLMINLDTAIYSTNIDSSGTLLVATSQKNELIMVDLHTGHEIDRVKIPGASVHFAYFISPDEIVATNINQQVIYYKLFSHQPAILTPPSSKLSYVWNIGSSIIQIQTNGSIVIMNKDGVVTKTIQDTLHVHNCVDVNQRIGQVAIGTLADILLFDKNGDSVGILQGHQKDVNSVLFSKNGTKLVSASDDESVIIWDIKSKHSISILDRFPCAPYNICTVNSAEFSHDGTKVVTTSVDRNVRLWDTSGALLCTMTGHTFDVYTAFFSQDDKTICSFTIGDASHPGTVRIWNLRGGEIGNFRGLNNETINNVIMDKDGENVYVIFTNGQIHRWMTPLGIYRKIKTNMQ